MKSPRELSVTNVEDVALRATVGSLVRANRLDKKWTLGQMSQRSGLSVRFLSLLESGQGNISVVSLLYVAQALEIPVSALLTAEEHDRAESTQV